MARKTFSVEELIEFTNEVLRESVNESVGIRQGMMNTLEEVLHRTGNYQGFHYLTESQVKSGYTFGINTNEDGSLSHVYAERFEGTDNTRVQYF